LDGIGEELIHEVTSELLERAKGGFEAEREAEREPWRDS